MIRATTVVTLELLLILVLYVPAINTSERFRHQLQIEQSAAMDSGERSAPSA